MPTSGEGWRGPIISILLHGLLLLLLLAPAFVVNQNLLEAEEGGGGSGPPGGGGGGSGGSGGLPIVEERIRYFDIAPDAIPELIPEPEAVLPPLPEPVPPPEPVVPPPEPVVPPTEPVPTPPPPPVAVVPEVKVDLAPATIAPSATSIVLGTGGGSGNDGTVGMGPGTGGGVGSGVGTGRGSSIGPGTGGGAGNIFLPSATQVFIPPEAPDRITPYTFVARFDVDERGRVLKIEFNESRDRDYNRRLRAMLAEVRFRPATTLEGIPVRATATIEFTVY